MFSKNLRYHRIHKKMSKKELADKVNVTELDITSLEEGVEKPKNMEIIKSLANALEIRTSDFLASRKENLFFNY